MDLNTVETVLTPATRAELPSLGSGDALLAGGTWLFSEPQRGLQRLIDLGSLGWEPVRVSETGLHMAATCRIAELYAVAAPAAWQAAHLIGACCHALLGSFKIWNEATVGGNLCLALPAGPMTSLTASLDGVCTIWTPDGGERRVPVLEFVRGNRCNALEPGEVLRAIDVPAALLQRRAAFRQISLSPVGRSAALLIGTIGRDFALTITASTPHPVRIAADALPDAIVLREAIEAQVTAKGLWFDDVHGDPAWRRLVTLTLAEQIRQELCG
jgi:CO/xanthine dehydrogenase FAD-binding subunit